MFGLLPNPWMILGVIALLGGAFGYGHHIAYLEQEAEIARLNEAQRVKEQAMQSQANAAATKLRKANQDAQDQIDRLKSDVAAGSVRLSVATRKVQTSGDPRAACGSGAEERSELDPATAQELIAITADGDNAIRQLNTCIDLYNDIRNQQMKD